MRRDPLRNILLLALLGAVAALLVGAPAAFADALTPESGGSPNADDIDTLYKIALYISIVIFLLVEGTLIYSLVKYRARRDGPEPAQIRGNTPLELGWTAGAALILVLLSAVTFIFLDDIKDPQASEPGGLEAQKGVQYATIDQKDPPGGKALKIKVNGQQYLWRYEYPTKDQVFSYYDMVVPTNTTVTLEITASDVVHSFWIPKLGGKQDAVPGHTNETWFRVTKPGTYEGVCAELCGENHADMRARVVAVPPDEYETWVSNQARYIKEAQDGLAEQRRAREAAEGQTAGEEG